MELRAMAPERRSSALLELRVTHGRIALEAAGEGYVVRFTGEIDIAFSRDDFAHITAAVRASGLPVSVDCSGVTFFSAEGIRMLDLLKVAAVDHRLASVVTSAALDRLRPVYPIDTFSVAA
jgi:hypothetical protein